MYKRALAGMEKALGPNHTSTLTTVNNLGILFYEQTRLSSMINLTSKWGGKSVNLYGCLGRMLLQRADELSAQIAFQQQVILRDAVAVFVNIKCDGCSQAVTYDTQRFICKQCQHGDLCGECFKKHTSDVSPIYTCLGHSFFEIYSQRSPSSDGFSLITWKERARWLQDLMAKYLDDVD